MALRSILGAVLVATAAGGTAYASSPGEGAAALQARALADAAKSGWVHQIEGEASSAGEVHCVGAIGPHEGSATCTIGGARLETLLAPNHLVYINGSVRALRRIAGLGVAGAKQLAGRWLGVAPGDSGYALMAASLETTPTLRQLRLRGPLTMGQPEIVGGQKVIPIEGSANPAIGVTGSATLYVSDAARPLPVRWSVSNDATVVLSAWGRVVHVTAPAGALLLHGEGAASPAS